MKLPYVIRGRRKKLFFRLVANGLAQATVTVGTVLLVRSAFDRLIRHNPSSSFSLAIWIGLGLVAAAVANAWLHMMERTDAEKMGQEYTHKVRMILFDHLSLLAPRALQKRSRGAVVLRFVGDLNSLKRWVSQGLALCTVSGITMVGTVIALSIINWVLALGVAAVLATGSMYALELGKELRESAVESRRLRSHLAANVNEKVASMAVVQVFGQSARERKRVGRQSRRLKESQVGYAKKLGQLRAIIRSTTALATAVVLLLGAHEVASGRATPGTVVAAMLVLGLLLPSLRDLGRVYGYWQSAHVSAKKIKEFLRTPSLIREIPNAPDLQPGLGRLEFEGVHLAESVHGITAVAEPGSVVALTGPNGAGKSTLMLLAARLMDPDEGRVLIDGQDLAKHSLASVHQAVGMVSPDLPLLRGTIEKNLRYRWPKAPDEEIARVKDLCEIESVVAELPDGEKTRVTEGGGNLSLGQRQRIALARALLGNPSILLLDEAYSHMDQESSRLLDRILATYSGTVLLVTHRPDKLINADVIWRMDDGRLVEVEGQTGVSGKKFLSLGLSSYKYH